MGPTWPIRFGGGGYWPDHWMRHRKWWWAFFIWAIGVADVNSYKIYDVMYKYEKKDGKMLPLKRTHGQFLEELVCDLLLPKLSMKNVDMLCQMDKEQLVASVNMTCLFSILAGTTASVTEESNNDLRCLLGLRMYLKKTKTTYIMRERMEGNFFKNWLEA
jgi:hypothetical protein